MNYLIANVAVDKATYSFDMLYSYLVPDELSEKAKPGCRVIVPFGNSKLNRQGVIYSLETRDSKARLKKITAVPDEAPLLNNEALSLALWLKERTFCTYFDAAKVQLPTGISLKINTTYVSVSDHGVCIEDETEKKIYDFLEERREYVSADEIRERFELDEKDDILNRMFSSGLILRNYDTVRKVSDATIRMVRISMDEETLEKYRVQLTKKQNRIIDVLSDIGCASVKELCYFTGLTEAVIKALAAKNVIEIFSAPTYRKPKNRLKTSSPNREIILTDEQAKAYSNMLEKYRNGGGVSLLYGVTGSGKTSVYMKLIDEILSDGKGIIVMVPEISLTPHLIALFNERYGDRVAVFHSGLSVGERYDEWKRIKNGDAQIAVGTRSAVFAPFDKLGLIIMDEEQEHTYKSEQSPRFHARDVAKFRAAYNKALCVLASATPSLESYTLAKKGRYSLETIKNRYGDAVLPDVIVADMRKERKNGNKYQISSILLEKLEENLKNGKQSILLINRRGYNTFAACDECGKVRVCPSCSVSLTYHSDINRLMCHYCGYSDFMDNKCPECGKKAVRFSGSGTQKIEDELKTLLPGARVVRMDTDSTLSRYAHEEKLSAFAKGDYDIMLGTQMVAKGLDFENVTLVGVLAADQEMNGGDYMSSEKAFDLLTQVVGRAGRGKNRGLAIIQTIDPDSSIIRLAQQQNYEAFYENEIYIRKFMTYPPYCDICAITFSASQENITLASSRCFLYGIKSASEEVYKDLKLIVLGPMPPKIGKIGGKFRYRIIVKCHNTKKFRDMIREILIRFEKTKDFKDVSVSVDFNPESLA
ncbi:MAG: primosomal protein N' [Acutalibacteraceae bacterium]